MPELNKHYDYKGDLYMKTVSIEVLTGFPSIGNYLTVFAGYKGGKCERRPTYSATVNISLDILEAMQAAQQEAVLWLKINPDEWETYAAKHGYKVVEHHSAPLYQPRASKTTKRK